MMTTPKNEQEVEALYQALLLQIRKGSIDSDNLAIVGIRSGGALLAERMAKDLNLEDRLGFINTAFYRDDYAEKGLRSGIRPTQIGFDVSDAAIILVDDVLYTGRTTRAAINELFDYGRPAKVLLAVLIDRGSRELPIAPDYVALNMSVSDDQTILLEQEEDGQFSLKVEYA